MTRHGEDIQEEELVDLFIADIWKVVQGQVKQLFQEGIVLRWERMERVWTLGGGGMRIGQE